MNQTPIKKRLDQAEPFTFEEVDGNWVELNSRTSHAEDGYNSIAELGVKLKNLVDNPPTPPIEKLIYFGIGAVSMSGGVTTTPAIVAAYVNGVGFEVPVGTSVMLSVFVLQVNELTEQIIERRYRFVKNNLVGTHGTGSEHGDISTTDLIENGYERILTDLSVSDKVYVDLGDIGVATIEGFINGYAGNFPELVNNELPNTGDVFYFSCVKNGDPQIYEYVGALPITIGSGNPVTVAADYDLISSSGGGSLPPSTPNLQQVLDAGNYAESPDGLNYVQLGLADNSSGVAMNVGDALEHSLLQMVGKLATLRQEKEADVGIVTIMGGKVIISQSIDPTKTTELRFSNPSSVSVIQIPTHDAGGSYNLLLAVTDGTTTVYGSALGIVNIAALIANGSFTPTTLLADYGFTDNSASWDLAEQNVNADWNAVSGYAQILNKPAIPTNNNALTNGAGYITDEDAAQIYIPQSDEGVANGVATLDATGKVPASQLPEDIDPWALSGSDIHRATGKVNIGSATIGANLLNVVGGNAYIERTGGGAAIVVNRTDGAAVNIQAGGNLSRVQFNDNGNFELESTSSANVISAIGGLGDSVLRIIGSTGFIGINQVAPRARLDVTGNIIATGDITTGDRIIAPKITLAQYTVATLPTSTGGTIAYVTDLATPTYRGTAVGGGSDKGLVTFDGTNWIT